MRVASILNPIGETPARLVRVLVVFLLLVMGVDLFLPQYFCTGQELGDSPIHTSAANLPVTTTVESSNVALYISQDSRPNQSSQHEVPHVGDCWCAHVLPSVVPGNLGYTEVKSSCAHQESDPLLLPTLQNTYRPPRFA